MRFLILTLIIFSQTLVGQSQTATGSIQGVITDYHGASVPNAIVVATPLNKGESTTFRAKTDYGGGFTFKGLTSGEYKLTAASAYFNSETERKVSVKENRPVEIVIELGLGCSRLSEGSGVVTDADRAKIANIAFADASSSLISTDERNKGIIVSSAHIRPEWLSGAITTHVKFLNTDQIQRRADRAGDFLFVSFPYLRAKGLCVALEVSYVWAVGKNSEVVHMDGGVHRYEFRKEVGKWVMKRISSWVS